MQLWLSRPQVTQLLQHVRAQAPREACGLLGSLDGRVARVVPIKNVAARPERRFELDAQQMVQTFFEFERDGLELCAIWHSHPQGEPLPSPEDIREASWPEACQLIIGTGSGQPQLAAWRIAEGEVDRVPLHVGNTLPEVDYPEETPTQRSAIWISAIAAVVLLLWLALTLLPPAPPLP